MKKDIKIILVFLFICFLFYSLIAVFSHNHFQTFGWDLGYFDQLIWKVSRGIYPYSTLSKVNLLAGHFAPILFLYAPLYWLWSDPRMLLVVQAFLMVIASYPLYLLSFEKTKNKLFSFSVIFSYLFFLGTQWSILNEFHEVTIAPLFLITVFYALEKKKNVLFWLGIIGLLMIKEEIALLVAAIGLTVFTKFKKKKIGIGIFIFSLLFFFFLTNIFMPAISEKGTYQHTHLSQDAKTPSEFLVKMMSDPIFAFKSLVTPVGKITTFVVSMLSFGLIPFFAPLSVLFPLIEQFLTRFLYTGPQYTFWQNVNHHAAPSAMLLAISTFYGAIYISKKAKMAKKQELTFLAILLFTVTFAQDVLLKAPIHSLIKRQFYETLPWMVDNEKILDIANKLQPSVPITTQNSMFPHISQRNDIYLLPEVSNAEYIVVDLHDGPNKYAPLDHDKTVKLINSLIEEKQFVLEKKIGEAMILKRKT